MSNKPGPPGKPFNRDRVERGGQRRSGAPGAPGLLLKKHATFDAVRAQQAMDKYPAATRSQFQRMLERAEEAYVKHLESIKEAKAKSQSAANLESQGRRMAAELEKLRDQRPLFTLGTAPRDWPKDPNPQVIEAAAAEAAELSPWLAALLSRLVMDPPDVAGVLSELALQWPEDPPPEQVLTSLGLHPDDVQLYLVFGMLSPKVLLVFKDVALRRGDMQAAKARVAHLFTRLGTVRLELERARLQQHIDLLQQRGTQNEVARRRLEQMGAAMAVLDEREAERAELQQQAEALLGSVPARQASGASVRVQQVASALGLTVLPTTALQMPSGEDASGVLRDAAGQRPVTCRVFGARETSATLQQKIGAVQELANDGVGIKAYGLVELPSDEVVLVQGRLAPPPGGPWSRSTAESFYDLLVRLRDAGYAVKDTPAWGLDGEGRAWVTDASTLRKQAQSARFSVATMMWRARRRALGESVFDGPCSELRDVLTGGKASWIAGLPSAQRHTLAHATLTSDEISITNAGDGLLRVLESFDEQDAKRWVVNEIDVQGKLRALPTQRFTLDGRDL